MENDNRKNAINKILEIAEKKGYVLFDDISDIADIYSLSLSDIDWLSNELTSRGIIQYEEKPPEDAKESDEYDDYAQSDYEIVYKKIIAIDPSLEPFIDKVRSIIPAQYGEISKLKYQVYDGNQYARERLIEIHLRNALRIALQRYETYDMDIEDAVGDACMGLTIAADKYNPDENGPFGSYASMWMLQYITRNQPSKRPLIYYPVHKKEKYFEAYRFLKNEDFISSIGVDEKSDAKKYLIEKMGVTYAEAEEIIIESSPIYSLDNLFDIFRLKNKEQFFSGINQLEEYIYENYRIRKDPNYYLMIQVKKQELNKMLNILSDRERDIVKLRNGIDCEKSYTLEEIGKKYNITRERIRQIESKAMRKLSSTATGRRIQRKRKGTYVKIAKSHLI